ncbi:hypothetical protein QUF64_15195 [Anaerolineales bacterium HSG6]|nr:hypothetical protein [Anaerolineales bacterium HSG6]MDM8531931.1 hypothetical protein [Anaerolineales bacterium HSG25]
MVSTNDDFTARLMDEMDPELLQFIKTKVTSFIKWDLIKFFHQNPHTTDTVENIAKYTGRDEQAVQIELESLAQNGLMLKTTVGQTTVYTITSNIQLRESIKQFVTACEDRHFRVKVAYHILQGLDKPSTTSQHQTSVEKAT